MIFIPGQRRDAGGRAKIAEDAALLIAQCGDKASLRARVRASIDWRGDSTARGEGYLHWMRVAQVVDRRLRLAKRAETLSARLLFGISACRIAMASIYHSIHWR